MGNTFFRRNEYQNTGQDSAKTCAEKLAGKLKNDVDLVNLKKTINIDISKYEKIIIGSSVYVGKIHKEAKMFCENNFNELKDKEIVLFISCMKEGKEAEKQLKDNFPEELQDKALVTGVFGGAFKFDKMNFFERMIIKKISGNNKSYSNIIEENINEFAEILNR